MLKVTRLQVRSFNLDHLDLFWEIGPVPGPQNDTQPHDIYDYHFFVLRSEAAMGPYDQIGGPFRDTYHFRDTKVSLLHKWRQYFYKLRIVHVPTGEEIEFGPAASVEPEPDRIASAIIAEEDVLFREFVGRRCYLFPVRTFGPRCSCFDVTLQRVTRANHLPCFGTGWLGGYMSPVEIFVQFDPKAKQTQVSQMQEGQAVNTNARCSSFPPISPRDILIESENLRWRVVNVTPTQRLRAVVHQEMQLHEVPKGDVEYALPVNLDPSTITPSAERNFTNRQNVDSNEDYSDILAFHGYRPRGSLR
jgi:hypothetical protein